MTGELTLTGRVLPAGGICEKVIAPKRNALKTALLPAANRGDFEKLPDYVKAGVTAHFVARYSDVLALVFPIRITKRGRKK